MQSTSSRTIPIPNDCEIIVMGKQLQQYAERVEKALKDIGLKVDLMFPKPDVTIQTFIENIASMGAGFAAVIKPENEGHQSLSVHVLKGVPKPEEHRNMPLNAALNLIHDRFIQTRRAEFGSVSPTFLESFALFADAQFIADREYKFMICYLHERWRKQKLILNQTEYDADSEMPSLKEVSERVLEVLDPTK